MTYKKVCSVCIHSPFALKTERPLPFQLMRYSIPLALKALWPAIVPQPYYVISFSFEN